MPKILKVEGLEVKKDKEGNDYGIVHVITDDGTEAEVYVGGACELYHDPKYDKVKAFVKRPPYQQ